MSEARIDIAMLGGTLDPEHFDSLAAEVAQGKLHSVYFRGARPSDINPYAILMQGGSL